MHTSGIREIEANFGKTNVIFHHLPPTAVPVHVDDFSHAIQALVHPEEFLRLFLDALKEYTGNPNCLLTSSGRSALTVILFTLKRISNRTKVIIPAYSCPTVVQSVLTARLQPIFCDVNPKTLAMDNEFLLNLLDDNVLAIIPTYLYGLPQDFSEVIKTIKDVDIKIIEDAAQALGASIHGHKVGNMGDFGFFSLGRGKCIPTGSGGVIVCRDWSFDELNATVDELTRRPVKRDISSIINFLGYGLATTPLGWWFVVHSPINPAKDGMVLKTIPPIHYNNYSSTQAGIGLSILHRIDQINLIRKRNAQKLSEILTNFPWVTIPEIPKGSEPVFLRFPIILGQKDIADLLFSRLSRTGIGVSRSYTRTLPDLYSYLKLRAAYQFPSAQHLADCLITLPTHSSMNASAFERIHRVFSSIDP